MVPEVWDKPLWESVWPHLDPWDSVRLRTGSTHWNVPKKYGPNGKLFSVLFKKSQWPSVPGRVRAVGLSRNRESMCLDWSAHDD